MLCERHHAIAAYMEHGIAYCLGCMREAVIEADTVELEEQIRHLTIKRIDRLKGDSRGNREAA